MGRLELATAYVRIVFVLFGRRNFAGVKIFLLTVKGRRVLLFTHDASSMRRRSFSAILVINLGIEMEGCNSPGSGERSRCVWQRWGIATPIG